MAATFVALLAFASAASAACVPKPGTCAAVSAVANQLRSCVHLNDFCYSLLDVDTVTVVQTAYSTPSAVNVTSTSTVTDYFTNILSQTVTDEATELATTTKTEVTTLYSTYLVTDVFTTTVTNTAHTTSTTVTTAVYTSTASTVVTQTQAVYKRVSVPALVSTPTASATATESQSCLASLEPADVTMACSCLSLPVPTVTVTDVLVLPTGTGYFNATASRTATTNVTVVNTAWVTATAYSTALYTITEAVRVDSTVNVTSTATTSTLVVIPTTLTTSTTTTTTAASTSTFTAAPTCGFNVLSNGNFESGSLSPWTFSGSISSYSLSRGREGSFSLGLSSNPSLFYPSAIATIFQNVALVPGKRYTFSLNYKTSDYSSRGELVCTVGSATISFPFDSVADNRWGSKTASFTADSSGSTVACTMDTSYYASLTVYLDNISVRC